MAIRVWWDTSVSAYRMTVPYNPKFVEALKQLIPSSDRQYEQASKIWTFSERYYDATRQLAETFCREKATVITKQQAEAAQRPPSVALSTVDSVLSEFCRLLPQGCLQAAYRKAAMEFHPDRGGSMEKMSKLNSLWTRIEQELYK